jgi:hypothetical protein
MHEGQRLQWLPGKWLDLREAIAYALEWQRPTFVLVGFDEIKEALAQGLKHQAPVLPFLVFMSEVFFEIDYIVLVTLLSLYLEYYLSLDLGAVIVAVYRSNHLRRVWQLKIYFDSIDLVLYCV